METIETLFSSNFMPHGHCYFWRPEIVWTNAISDAVIAIAYMTIPFTLLYIVKVRRDINYISLLFLFAIFILGCGATHVMDVINIWTPFYYLDSSIRVVTALASIGTAIMLVKITPKLLLIPNANVFKNLSEELTVQLKQLEEKEQQLREREALLLETQEIGRIGSYDLDVKTSKYKWTPQMYAIFGFSYPQEITREMIFDRVHPEDRLLLSEAIARARQNRDDINVEYRLLLPDGRVKHIWSRGIFHYDDKGEAIRMVGTVLDYTDERKKEEELIAVQSQLSEVKEFVFLAESVQQLVWATSHDGDADYFNQKFYEYTNLNKIEALNWGWQKVIHPDDLGKTLQLWEESIKGGTIYQVEMRVRKFDGSYRWFLTKASPMKNSDGKVVRWFGTSTDIDDLKRSEEELIKKNHELLKTNRDLDNFVYTASHDLKAPVANLEGLIMVHRKKVMSKLTLEEVKILDLMETSVNRFRDTIKELTEISKIGKNLEEDIELVFFNEAIQDFKEDLSNEINVTQTVLKYNLQVPDVYFSRRNFKSIIYNLLSNAIKYRSEERRPQIEIETYREGDFVVLSVKDNGLGFDISKKETVFSMFRRLHSHVEGTGIGMYIVKRVIEDAGGKIEVESKIGEGSIFKVYFI